MKASRRIGRPPLDEDDPSVGVNVRLPSKEYDALYRRAQDNRCSPPEQLRREMRAAAAEKDKER